MGVMLGREDLVKHMADLVMNVLEETLKVGWEA